MHLGYEPLNYVHAKGLLNIWEDEEVIKYTNMKLPCTLEYAKSRVGIFKPFDVFVVMQDKNLIGIIGCPPVSKEESEYGIFYQFCKSSWGKGYGSMATEWLINYMKDKYSSLTLLADVIVDNVASEMILKRFEFKLISEEIIEKNGKKLKVHNYKKEV